METQIYLWPQNILGCSESAMGKVCAIGLLVLGVISYERDLAMTAVHPLLQWSDISQEAGNKVILFSFQLSLALKLGVPLSWKRKGVASPWSMAVLGGPCSFASCAALARFRSSVPALPPVCSSFRCPQGSLKSIIMQPEFFLRNSFPSARVLWVASIEGKALSCETGERNLLWAIWDLLSSRGKFTGSLLTVMRKWIFSSAQYSYCLHLK